jgi:NADPH-dependent curcumin reductase
VSDHMNLWSRASGELQAWVLEGKLRYRESIAQGLAAAPKAFIAMLRGDKIGKQLVRLEEP